MPLAWGSPRRTSLPRYFAFLTLVLMLATVATRVIVMKGQGIKALHFGNIDKRDFLIPPFALFYFYVAFAATFDLPAIGAQPLFHSELAPWIGTLLCAAGLSLLAFSLVSFGRSFRVGIDMDHPDTLITSGAFAFSRNPIYVAFAAILMGEFLVFLSGILLAYVGAAIWLLHRQILREEEYLRGQYGLQYAEYCRRVKRYL